jgi:hypothetical protein
VSGREQVILNGESENVRDLLLAGS